jgi:acyl-CoA thioester hydrolase
MSFEQTLPALTETQRGTVGAWQCDSNDHWNVQFYCMQFDLAARFAGMTGGAPVDAPEPQSRLMRFHSELVAGDIFSIETGRISDGAHQGSLVHLMRHISDGKLIATALDAPTRQGESAQLAQVSDSSIASAMPRSVDHVYTKPVPYEQLLEQGAFVAARSWVTMAHCTASGMLTEQHLAAILADAAGHIWERAGAGVGWLRQRGYGRAAVEVRVDHHQPARAGDALVLLSRIGPVQGKTVRLLHQIYRMQDHAPIAGGEVVALLIDKATRRSIPIPDFLMRADPG